DFLLIGVNHYTNPNFNHADRTDLLWINKYEDPAPVTTCPASSTFGAGIFKDLRNGDNTIGFTPVPAIQTDTDAIGWVITESDIERPDICGTGTQVSVHAVRPNPSNPSVPQLNVRGSDSTVGSLLAPPDAPQLGTS